MHANVDIAATLRVHGVNADTVEKAHQLAVETLKAVLPDNVHFMDSALRNKSKLDDIKEREDSQ